MRPAALPRSRISETRATTKGSAELKFRIQSAPAASHANFRFLAGESLRADSADLQTSIDVASLAPNAEITVYPWKEPEELRQRTIDRVRRFLKVHIPMRAAAQ